jgi:iron complex transport system substrate-binding protein
MLASMVGAREGRRLVASWKRISATPARRPETPARVYFEEWDEPMISAIRWVSELVAIAGGEDVLRGAVALAGRNGPDVTTQGRDRAPARRDHRSWCGKKFRPERVARSPGWQEIPGGQGRERLYEIKSAEILQPGPAALTDGVRRCRRLFCWDVT